MQGAAGIPAGFVPEQGDDLRAGGGAVGVHVSAAVVAGAGDEGALGRPAVFGEEGSHVLADLALDALAPVVAVDDDGGFQFAENVRVTEALLYDDRFDALDVLE